MILCIYSINRYLIGIEAWCNGSTTDFGSVCPGSSPGVSTSSLKVSKNRLLLGKGKSKKDSR